MSDFFEGELPGEFSPGTFHDKIMDNLVVLLEDTGYVTQSVDRPHDIEILWHHQEDRIVGVKIWDISSRRNGPAILARLGVPTP